MTKIQKIIGMLIIAVIILAGVIVSVTLGYNFDLRYERTDALEIYIQKEFNNSDIKKITDEFMPGKEVLIQKVEVFEDTVRISAEDITDEEKNNIINKVNEVYETELVAEDITTKVLPHTRATDILKPYVTPLLIATTLIMIYVGIRYRKLNPVKVISKLGLTLILAESILFSIIAITRLPIGKFTNPFVLVVYVIVILIFTIKCEKEMKNIEPVKVK